MKRNQIVLQYCLIFVLFLAGCVPNNHPPSFYQNRLDAIMARPEVKSMDFSPTGRWVILNYGWFPNANELTLIEMDTQTEVTVSLPIPEEGYCYDPSYSPGEDTLILLCQTKGGIGRDDFLIRLDLTDLSSIVPEVLDTQWKPSGWSIVWDSAGGRFCAVTSKYGMIIIYEGTEAIKQIELGGTNSFRVIFVNGTIYLDVRTISETGIHNHVVYKLPEPYDLPPVEIYSYVTNHGSSFWTDSRKKYIAIPWNDPTPEGDDRLMFTILSARDGRVVRQVESPLLGQVLFFQGKDHLFIYQINEQDGSRIDNRLYAMSWRNFRFTSQEKPVEITRFDNWRELYLAMPVWVETETFEGFRLVNFEK